MPISLYGITKLAGEHIVNNAECDTIIVRPFTIYGKDGRKDEVIYRWLEQYKNELPMTVYGDGTSCRGYVYVEDLIKTTVDILLRKNDTKHDDFNLGGSEIIYINDIVNVFKKLLNDANFIRLDLPVEDILINYANIEKAKKAFGFDPQPRFIKNLEDIIKEFKQEQHESNNFN